MPRYYPLFRCAAGDCPDTCCQDWEVVLDEASVAYFRTVPGELGDTIRAAIGERDGEPCFDLKNGFCPMLRRDGLCRVQRELGEEHLSHICDVHPRFAEEYGALRELALTMGCPEAVRLMLGDDSPQTYREEKTDEPLSGYNDLNAALFFALGAARKTAFAIAQDRSQSITARTDRLLAFAGCFQRALDGHRLNRLGNICARWAAPAGPDGAPEPMPEIPGAYFRMEPINGCWPALLSAAADAPDDRWQEFCAADRPVVYEHLLWYFLYRYALKAVNDRRFLPRVKFAAETTALIRRLLYARWRETGALTDADRVDLIHRCCREVEHSQENRELLLERL